MTDVISGDTAELRAKQVAWQNWRNDLYGDMKYALKQAGLASRHSTSEKAIEGSLSTASEYETRYAEACKLNASIKLTRKEQHWDDHARFLDQAIETMR